MCLRHKSDDLTSVQDCCHIIQFAMISKWSTNKDQGIHICRFFCNLQQSFPCTVQKPSLQEQILAGVTSDTKFRKNHNFDMFFFHFADKSDDFISICITVCNCDIWCCGCCFDITVSHFLPLFSSGTFYTIFKISGSDFIFIYTYAEFLSALLQ